jgi:hypothetical protein
MREMPCRAQTYHGRLVSDPDYYGRLQETVSTLQHGQQEIRDALPQDPGFYG